MTKDLKCIRKPSPQLKHCNQALNVARSSQNSARQQEDRLQCFQARITVTGGLQKRASSHGSRQQQHVSSCWAPRCGGGLPCTWGWTWWWSSTTFRLQSCHQHSLRFNTSRAHTGPSARSASLIWAGYVFMQTPLV